jgi:hypothetical protein
MRAVVVTAAGDSMASDSERAAARGEEGRGLGALGLKGLLRLTEEEEEEELARKRAEPAAGPELLTTWGAAAS